MQNPLINYGLIFIGVLALTGCDKGPKTEKPVTQTSSQASSAPSSEPEQFASKRHFYDFNEGLEYGYSAAISTNQQQAGLSANQVIMVKYAGERNGKYQIHLSQGNVVTAIECSNPCEVMKIMSFIDADYMRDQVNVERFRFNLGTVGGMAITDALSGELRQYAVGIDGKRYQLWVEEDRGYRRYPLVQAKAKNP